MLYLIGYLFLLLIELVFSIAVCAYTLALLISAIKGAPYVPTKESELMFIFTQAGLKKGQTFLELGSGDGRVSRFAVKHFGVKGRGVDVNIFLIWLARLKTRWQKLKGVSFERGNVFTYDFKKPDVLYQFLMPEMIVKLAPRFAKELKKGTLIISHGFKIPNWEKHLVKSLERKPFPTYYYRSP